MPYITPFGFEGEANSGDSVQLACYVAKGDTPLSILWSFQGKDSSTVDGVATTKIGNRTSLLTIASVVAGHGGEYTCTAQNAGGLANHSAVLLVNGIVHFMLSVCTICSCVSIFKLVFLTHLDLLLVLRMSGAIPPLPHVPSWHAQGQCYIYHPLSLIITVCIVMVY